MGSKLKQLWEAWRGHLQENVARYAVAATAVLVPAAGWLGQEGARLAGTHASIAKALIGLGTALGTAAAAVTFIRNLGIWQMLDTFGVAPGVQPTQLPGGPGAPSEAAVLAATAGNPDEAMGADTAPDDPEVSTLTRQPLVGEDRELASPPPVDVEGGAGARPDNPDA